MKLLNLGAVKEERNACMGMVMAWHGIRLPCIPGIDM